MTPNESKILTLMERKGEEVAATALQISTQFSWDLPYTDLMLRSLMKQLLLIEKDRRHYRLTATALDALKNYTTGCVYKPFEENPAW